MAQYMRKTVEILRGFRVRRERVRRGFRVNEQREAAE